MLRIKRESNAERIEERDSDLRVLDEDSWRLIRVLMIEVNMITYEWNKDDLKENERWSRYELIVCLKKSVWNCELILIE